MTGSNTASGDSSHSRDHVARSLQRSLAGRLVAVSLLATLVLGVFVFFQGGQLITDAVEAQLTSQQRAQARAIADGLEFVGDSVSVIARDEATVRALSDFAAAFQQLTDEPDLIDSAQAQQIEEHYRNEVVPILDEAGLAPPPGLDLAPLSDASKYLQYQYVVTNPFEPGEREQLRSADGDASAYGAAHEQHHANLDQQRIALGFTDLILLDSDGTIVYTAEKRIDFGRNIEIDQLLGEGIVSLPRELAAAAIGEPVLVDFALNPAADGAPTLLGAATLSGPQGTIGAVVVEIPIQALNRITTADAQWQQIGLGETGETYVVGEDLAMRSDSRLWLELPDTYLGKLDDAGYPPELGDSIERFGTTVLLQPVDTDPAVSALEGESFVGRSRDYLGRPTLAASERIDNDQVNWAVVAQIGVGEAGRPLGSYLERLLLAAAIVVPLVGLAGIILARAFTAPFRPVVAAAENIAGGDLNVTIPDLGRNEANDVARRLTALAASIRRQDEALASERAETARLLSSALPARLVEQVRNGKTEIEDIVDNVTAVAITISGVVESPSVDPDTAADYGARVSHDLETEAARLGLERVRSSAGQHVFLSGLGKATIEAPAAARFAQRVAPLLDRFVAETGLEAGFRIGISSGKVISGMLATELLTYGVFGKPPQQALLLAGMAASGQILVDSNTAHDLRAEFEFEPDAELNRAISRGVDALVLQGDPATAPSGDSTDSPE